MYIQDTLTVRLLQIIKDHLLGNKPQKIELMTKYLNVFLLFLVLFLYSSRKMRNKNAEIYFRYILVFPQTDVRTRQPDIPAFSHYI